MEAYRNRKNTFTVTGVFASSKDAEIAYQLLMELGYAPGEVTIIMSDRTGESFCRKHLNSPIRTLGSDFRSVTDRKSRSISNAINKYGKFIALPGVSLVVAGDFNDGGVRAMNNSIMSDKYADFYQSVIKEGEIVIDFTPHSAREKNIIMDSWENHGGYPIIRRADHAA